MATLKELGKNDYSDDFEVFWKGVLKKYGRISNDNIQIYGSKKDSWAKYQQLGAKPDHVSLLLEQVEKMVDFYIAQQKATGYSNSLPHIKTWLNQQRFKDIVPDYVAPAPKVRKLPTDRPMPKAPELPVLENYTPGERAKMQADFKSKIKGVRKGA